MLKMIFWLTLSITLGWASIALSLGQITPPGTYCERLDPEFLILVDSILDETPEKYMLPQNHERVKNGGSYIAKATWLSYLEKVKLMRIFLDRTQYKGHGSFKFLQGAFNGGTLFYYSIHLLWIDSSGAVLVARLPQNFPLHLRNSENLPDYLNNDQYKVEWKVIH